MKRKIHILYIITKLELGGAQIQLLSLIRGLDKDRYKIFLFTAKTGFLVEEILSFQDLTIARSIWLERAIHPLRDFFAMLSIISFIKRNKIDIVHTHSSKAGIVGRWAAYFARVRRIVHTVHGWSFNDFQKPWLKNLYVCLERWTAKITNRIVVVSEYDKRKGLVLRIGSEVQYQLIRYGIDKSRFGERDRSIRGALGIREDQFVVGTIACLKPQKAPQDFVSLVFLAARVLPNAKFLLVGDGVLREKIEKMISRLDLGMRVILTGWRRDIPKILAALDVFVLTSLWEGLPIAVLEAMAAGVPVVATDTGGIAEVVEEGKGGFLVPCRDMPSMLKKLEILSRDFELRGQMTRYGSCRMVGAFSIEQMVKTTEALYEEAFAEPMERTGCKDS